MKRLTLIRHAKAVKGDPTLADFDRPLNERGERDAAKMGKRLVKHKLRPDLIISSPARRALSTAVLIAEEIGYPRDAIVTDEDIYAAELATLVQVIQRIDNAYQHVILCGHNPGFLLLCRYLVGPQIDELPTCAVVSADVAVDAWDHLGHGSGRLVLFDSPRKAHA